VELFEALEVSRNEFERRLLLIGGEDWGRPTPCSKWDVRALVNHVIGGCRRYTMLLHGASADELWATKAEYVGGDTSGSFRKAADEMLASFAEPDALSRTVHHPDGDCSGQVLAGMRVGEFAVHGWDLARAIGADEMLSPDLVGWCSGMVSGMGAALSRSGHFQAPRGELPASATAQDRLLHFLGRSPS
jgi:uncharacterized protein (TIGR03086 family)